jgi:cation:H+ antiporter
LPQCRQVEADPTYAHCLAYTLFLVMASQQHDALPAFSWVMDVFVIPLTAVTLLVFAARSRRQHRKRP